MQLLWEVHTDFYHDYYWAHLPAIPQEILESDGPMQWSGYDTMVGMQWSQHDGHCATITIRWSQRNGHDTMVKLQLVSLQWSRCNSPIQWYGVICSMESAQWNLLDGIYPMESARWICSRENSARCAQWGTTELEHSQSILLVFRCWCSLLRPSPCQWSAQLSSDVNQAMPYPNPIPRSPQAPYFTKSLSRISRPMSRRTLSSRSKNIEISNEGYWGRVSYSWNNSRERDSWGKGLGHRLAPKI